MAKWGVLSVIISNSKGDFNYISQPSALVEPLFMSCSAVQLSSCFLFGWDQKSGLDHTYTMQSKWAENHNGWISQIFLANDFASCSIFIFSQDWTFKTEADWEPCPELPGQCERPSRTFWEKMNITRIEVNAHLYSPALDSEKIKIFI